MVVHHDNRPEPFHEINAISVAAVITVPAPRALASRTPETRATLASRHDDRGFRSPMSARFLQTLQLVPPTMGIVPASSKDNEKGLSVVILQVAKEYWAYAPCTMPHASEPCIKSQSSPTATTTPAVSVPKVPAKHPKPSQRGSTKSTFTGFTLLPNTLTRAYTAKGSCKNSKNYRSMWLEPPLLPHMVAEVRHRTGCPRCRPVGDVPRLNLSSSEWSAPHRKRQSKVAKVDDLLANGHTAAGASIHGPPAPRYLPGGMKMSAPQ